MAPLDGRSGAEGEVEEENTSIAYKAPYVFKPEPNHGGVLGALQTATGLVFLFFMSSCYYMVLASALYILLGPLVLGHTMVPMALLAIWIGQAYTPCVEYYQFPHVLKRSWVFREVVRYFDMQVVMEEQLDTSRQYLFAQYPHGIIPLASFLSCYYVADVVPGKQIFCCVHSGIFHLPIVRHVLAAVGAVPANPENIATIKGLNANCSVVVGGVSEMWLQSDDALVIKLRKGFIREALRHGYHLCPMFHYGNDRLYRFVGGADLWRRISKALPFPFFLAYGKWVGPFLPRRTPIITAVGLPIDPAAVLGLKPGDVMDEPSEQDIHVVYERFKQEIRRHYYKHRPQWETRDLAFLEAEHPVTASPTPAAPPAVTNTPLSTVKQ